MAAEAQTHRSTKGHAATGRPVSDVAPPGDPVGSARGPRWLQWLRRIPPEAILVGAGLFIVLAALIAADPNTGSTSSGAPFTDEAFNVVNARNLVQLGTWSTDEWNLYLVNLPFSVLEAATFQLIGVGIVQARLIMALCVSLTAMGLVWGLRGALGRTCSIFAGLAFGFSGLVLFYGRLAFLEDLAVLGLTLGTLVLARDNRLSLRSGTVSGLCYAVAIGTKPSAVFAVAGILLAIGVAWGRRDAAVRAWLAGSVAMVALAGMAWAIAIWLPNRAAVAIDVKIWPPYQWNLTPRQLLDSVASYLTSGNDHLFTRLLLPLLGMGLAGLVAIVVLRKRLSVAEARLAVAAGGWLAFGFGILMVVSYRPNRYVVPLVPALAILAAIGLHLFLGWLHERLSARPATVDEGGPAEPTPRAFGQAGRVLPAAVVALAVLVTVAPGLAGYAIWARSASYDTVAIQNQFADAVPPGSIVAGRDSALFLMRSKAETVIVGLANQGDVYAQGARWYLEPSDSPAPNGVPEATWAARDRVTCAGWRGETVCLYHLR